MKDERRAHVNITLNMHRKGAPQYFAQKVREGLSKGISIFKLRVPSDHNACYPNICVPIAAFIDYYATEFNCTFIPAASWRDSPVLGKSGTLKPYIPDPSFQPASYLNKVWKFTADNHYIVATGIIESIRRAGEMASGVLQGFELALYEITDNILLHSQKSQDDPDAVGYVMVQYHKNEKRIAAAVFDLGQGIPASLARKATYSSLNKAEALSEAIKQGVGDGMGAGNGLWMMQRIVRQSAGSFELTSDGARFSLRHASPDDDPSPAISTVNSLKSGTTLVDFQLQTALPLDIVSALEVSPVNLWMENHIIDNPNNLSGELLYISVAEESRGFASRHEAKSFANLVGNLLEGSSNDCVLDFSEVPLISGSFADELLVRLIRRFGIVAVIQRVSFSNLSASNEAIFNRCFQGRLMGPE